MDSERVLVIILSTTLMIFLLLAILATVKVIQILDHIKKITEKAESIADKAEAVGDFFQKSAGPLAVGRLITNLAETVFQNKRSKKRKYKEEDDA
jgi:hypothetical protein